ncbi:MAG: glycosyltransferase [Caldilineaceae bacterium]|nr:glycosyltransferase [Caldilineaceae bacterium]
MKPTILFVTEIRPCPAYGGVYMLCQNTLQSLYQSFNVAVIAPAVEPTCPIRAPAIDWQELPAYAIHGWAKANNFRYILQPRPAWLRRLQASIQAVRPQVVWFSYNHWGQYLPPLRTQGIRAIMQTHNVQSLLTRQWSATMPLSPLRIMTQLRAWSQSYHEKWLFRAFDRVVSVTEADRHYHAQFVGDARSVLIPTYINEADYLPTPPIPRADNLLIMTGHFGTFQNSQGAEWFLREIWPTVRHQLPQLRLQFVGARTDTLAAWCAADPAIECVDSPPTVVPYLRRATLAVAPLLHGSGMRFKILEAFASELPVVSTTLGAQGIQGSHGETMWLADSAPAFAQAIVTLLQNQAQRTQLAAQGLALFRKEYTESVNTARIRHLVEEILC